MNKLIVALSFAAVCHVLTGYGAEATTTGWFVQVGSFQRESNATAALDKLSAQGLPATMERGWSADTPWYLVRLGPYQTEGLALRALQSVRLNGFALAKVVKSDVNPGTSFLPVPDAAEYRKDYERASAEGTVASYELFAKQYCEHDPDGLVPAAVQKARALRHAADRKIWLFQLPEMIGRCKTVDEQLAHERKIGKTSGFVDKQLMYELGQKKVHCDENIKDWQKTYELLQSGADASAYLDQFVPTVCTTASAVGGKSLSKYDLRTDFGKLEEGVKTFFKLQREVGSEGIWETLQTGYSEFERKPDPAQFQYLAAIDLANYRWANNFKNSRPSLYATYPDSAKDMYLVRARLNNVGIRLGYSVEEADDIVANWLPKVAVEMDNYMRLKLGK